ncbi:DnaD domain-containing protein [Desulfoscipio sp. XC116]|uniref:DnaD domain-containing protein n=1 Tax=Desulfoscipio sp. XC116 TaxID=3144975 RepID=UPI00325A6C6B
MVPTGTVNTVKKYKKGNITAAFGVDLFIHGSTAIPNLLLKLYKHMGIKDTEMMLLIQLFRLFTEENNYLPTVDMLFEHLSGDDEQINCDLENLINNGMLKITEFYDAERELVIKGYDFEPLFEKLSEIWACARVKQHEAIKKITENKSKKTVNLYKSFEKEFGRPLSPMEIEQIDAWSQKMPPPMVLEALRRAVMMGKHNFKYIDSILLEWEKNNLTSPEKVEDYDRLFKMKHTENKRKPINNRSKADHQIANQKDNRENNKKSMIQSLYMS